MQIDISLVISAIALVATVVNVVAGLKRNAKAETQSDTSQLTTVIVKLENISSGITEIKTKVGNVEADLRELRDRVIKGEESIKQAHKRIDEIVRRLNGHDSENHEGGY